MKILDTPWGLILRFGSLPAMVGLFLLIPLLAGCDASPSYTGTVAETRGQCWTMIGDPETDPKTGKPVRKRYAVSAEDGRRLGWKAGAKVTVTGRVAARQDCAAGVKIEAE